MKNLLVLLAALSFFTEPAIAQKENTAVTAVYNQYKTALLNNNGKAAVALLDSRTMAYYSGLLDKVLHIDSAALRQASKIDEITILTIRQMADPAEIKSWDAKALLAYSIDQGLVGKSMLPDIVPKQVSVNKDFAKAELAVNEPGSGQFMHFYKEQGKWYINLTDLFSYAEAFFTKAIADSGLSEQEFLAQIRENMPGNKSGNQVWHPIQ